MYLFVSFMILIVFVQQRVINNDNIKQHIAKTNNIELLRIWETDINNFNMELLI